jgi:hypothetical protein
MTRATLMRSAAAGGALAATGLLATGFPGRAAEPDDATILAVALAMERLEIAFYESALERAGLTGELREYAETALRQEREHEAYLEEALGGGRDVPDLRLSPAVSDAEDFTRRAIDLEDVLVWSRNGQAGNLSAERLAAVATIASVEARHSAWIRELAGAVPAPLTVDESLGLEAGTRRLRQAGIIA